MAITEAAGPPPGSSSGVSYPARRCYVLSGTGPSFVAPAAGGAIDGVSGLNRGGGNTNEGWVACRGVAVKVQPAANFAAGVNLVTTADGRAQTGAGTTVLRALEASVSDGQGGWLPTWCVFV